MPTVWNPTTVKPRRVPPDHEAAFVDRRGSFLLVVRSEGMEVHDGEDVDSVGIRGNVMSAMTGRPPRIALPPIWSPLLGSCFGFSDLLGRHLFGKGIAGVSGSFLTVGRREIVPHVSFHKIL